MFKNRKNLVRQLKLKLIVTLENKVLTDAAEAIMQEKNEPLNPSPLLYISTKIIVSYLFLAKLNNSVFHLSRFKWLHFNVLMYNVENNKKRSYV